MMTTIKRIRRKSLLGLGRTAEPAISNETETVNAPTTETTPAAEPESTETEPAAEPEPAAEAAPAKPKARRGRKPKAAAEAEVTAVPEAEPEAEPAAETEAALPIERLKSSAAGALAHLPAIDAPAVNPHEPVVSYKLDFKDNSSWYASTDGGKTKTCVGSAILAGVPVDLALQISAAQGGREGFDQRFRLAFIEPDGGDGTLAELNLNATSTDRDGQPYVTSGARSLAGALLAISESEEDMATFCRGARFRIQPGRGKGVFVQVDLAMGNRWVEMASALNTTAVPKSVPGFHATLAMIKQRFRSCNLLLTSAAVTGTVEDWHTSERGLEGLEPIAVDVTAVIAD